MVLLILAEVMLIFLFNSNAWQFAHVPPFTFSCCLSIFYIFFFALVCGLFFVIYIYASDYVHTQEEAQVHAELVFSSTPNSS